MRKSRRVRPSQVSFRDRKAPSVPARGAYRGVAEARIVGRGLAPLLMRQFRSFFRLAGSDGVGGPSFSEGHVRRGDGFRSLTDRRSRQPHGVAGSKVYGNRYWPFAVLFVLFDHPVTMGTAVCHNRPQRFRMIVRNDKDQKSSISQEMPNPGRVISAKESGKANQARIGLWMAQAVRIVSVSGHGHGEIRQPL